MKVDREAARRRVMSITGWAAAGAAALTAGLAFGASRNGTATATSAAPTSPTAPSRQAPPDDPGLAAPQAGDGSTSPGYGFTPPSGSSGPPAAMSGGS
jgi:hypothetical protein